MQYEVIDLFLYNLLGIAFRHGLKVPQLRFTQWLSAFHSRVENLNYFAVLDDKFHLTFSPLTLAMYMDGLMFIGVKQHNNSKIFVEFRHL